MLRFVMPTIAVVAVACAPHASLAFGTIRLLGQNAEHEKITRLGLASFRLGPRTLTALAGTRGSFGAVGAPDRLDRGLLSQASAHCDGGDALAVQGYPQTAAQALATLQSCRTWIFNQLNEAVRDAGALVDASGRVDRSQVPPRISCNFNGSKERAKCNVLESLGLAFHASQDFYSHSNWVDIANPGETTPKNPPGLANNVRAPWLDPRADSAAPTGLISGCFEGIPESRHCRYGEASERVKHQYLSKDTGQIDPVTGTAGQGTTSRGRHHGNFTRAVKAAIDDSRDKWAYFEARVLSTYGASRGKVIVCVMRRDDPAGCKP